MFKLFDGYKSYIVAFAMVVYAVAGGYLQYVEPNEAIELVFAAAAVAGIRHGISKN